MANVLSLVLNNFKNDTRVLKECTTLSQHGFTVQVVALHEEGVAEWEQIGDVLVHRVKLSSRRLSKNLWVQSLKYLELIVRVLRRHRKADVIHCNDLGPLPIAVLIKWLSFGRTKIVYDAHEYETEANGLCGFKKRLACWTERALIGQVDQVITVSEGIAKEYGRLYGIEEPSLILNCPRYRKVDRADLFRERFGIRPDQTIFLYQGMLSKGRGIEVLLEAFAGWNQDDAVVIFLGYGPLAELIQEAAQKWSTIYYHEAVAPDVLLSYTSSADVGISLIENTCLSYYYCLPNKIFEFAMSGLPVLVSDLPEMRKMVDGYRFGSAVESATPNGIRRSMERLLKQDLERYRENALRFAKSFNWEREEQMLLSIYKRLIN